MRLRLFAFGEKSVVPPKPRSARSPYFVPNGALPSFTSFSRSRYFS
jgi:hypothetical protein